MLVVTRLRAVALLVLGTARLTGAGVHGWWVVMCACGTALGLVGVLYCRRRQRPVRTGPR